LVKSATASAPASARSPGPRPDSRRFKILFIVAAVAGSLWLLQRLATVVVLLVLSTLLAYVIAPSYTSSGARFGSAARRRVCPRGLPSPHLPADCRRPLGGAALVLPKMTEQVKTSSPAPGVHPIDSRLGAGWTRYTQSCGYRSSCGGPSIATPLTGV